MMLAHTFVESLEFDSEGIERRIVALQDPEALQQMMSEPTGLAGLLSPDDDGEAIGQMRGVLAVVEGYAEHLVRKTAGTMIPSASLLRGAIDMRRTEASQGEQLLHQAVALDLRHSNYRRGDEFCTEVEKRWGEDALNRIWDGPEMVPTEQELADPVGWAARVLL
jgi:putative hydrolase